MKKIIAYPITNSLYHLGDFISKKFSSETSYNLYSWCMVTSGDIQDWAGLEGPWEKTNE